MLRTTRYTIVAMIPPDNYIVAQAANKVLLAPPAARPFCILLGVEGAPVASAEPGGQVKEKSDPRETEVVFLNVPEKLDDPFPDLASFRENRPEARLLPRGARAVGHDPHGCLGALLALAEARISPETLLRRMPNLRLDETREIRWYRSAAYRGPDSLPLIF